MFLAIFLIFLVVFIIFGVIHEKKEQKRIGSMTPDEKQKHLEEKQRQILKKQHRAAQAKERNHNLVATGKFGPINAALVCPHCQTKGKVRTKRIKQKKGVSGSKAAAAVITGGLSVLAVGLSRKEASTQAHCDNCGSTWLF